MTEPDMIRITYGGKDFWLESNEASLRSVAQIESRLRDGGFVRLEHTAGIASVGISPGVPVTVEYLNTSDTDVANTYY